MYFSRTFRALAFLVGTLLYTGVAFGASGEVSAFGGGTTFTGGGGSATHGLFGGSGGIMAHERTLLFGEYSAIPISVLSKSYFLSNFGGGIDYSFKDRGASKVVPYALVAAGGTHSSFGGASGYYFGVGGGARMYAGKNWGVKPEVRYQRYGGNGSANAFTYTVGVFFQFGQ